MNNKNIALTQLSVAAIIVLEKLSTNMPLTKRILEKALSFDPTIISWELIDKTKVQD